MPRAPSREPAGTVLATWLMTVPAVTAYTALLVVPIGVAGYLSLTDWDGYSADPGLVGLANYVRVFADPEVVRAAAVTFVVAAAGTAALNLLGLALAVLVAAASRFHTFLRLVFFYPHVLSVLAVGFLWSAILGTNGAVNSYLTSRGAEVLPFLSDPEWAVGTMIAVLVWAGFGVNVVLYLAGLQSVPAELVEAARIDGADRWQVFRNVTLPALRPVVTLNLVLCLITLLKTYDLVVSLTGGGPAGATQTVAYLILWDSFHASELGFGSAQSVLLMVVTAALALSVMRLRARSDMAAYR
ncbi:sugar ABC transporter permease [Actinopolymorpha sp. B11F2]|uniref:carbohydrate ABC transporter permease n=1 Tax=Actinopolymorpha sp. B11F2 TaxID=3160862 RepID=UPI0032E442F5